MKDGDFIKIEFVGKVKDTGEIFDLTDEAVAKKEDIHNPQTKYGPSLIILGSGGIIQGVEEEVKKMKIGQEKEFDVPHEKAFGKRNPALIKILSMSKFIQNKINPIPGQFVNIDGATCKIQSVSGGRIRVDFNNPLAGKDLHYKVKLVESVEGAKKKLDALLQNYGIDAETTVSGEKAVIKMKKPNPGFQKVVENMVKEWVKEIKSVSFE